MQLGEQFKFDTIYNVSFDHQIQFEAVTERKNDKVQIKSFGYTKSFLSAIKQSILCHKLKQPTNLKDCLNGF